MVDYDSIIPPGQEGHVIQQIKVSKLRSGRFTKSIKVTSNAENIPALRLSVSGKILSVINQSSRFLHLRPNKEGKVNGSVVFSTEKQNFKIKEIYFKENKGSGPSWQQQPELYLTHNVTRADTADSDGYYAYTVKFSLDMAPPTRISGVFSFITNHPERKKIDIRGMISPLEKQNE